MLDLTVNDSGFSFSFLSETNPNFLSKCCYWIFGSGFLDLSGDSLSFSLSYSLTFHDCLLALIIYLFILIV